MVCLLGKSPVVCGACKTSNNNKNRDTVCVEKGLLLNQ